MTSHRKTVFETVKESYDHPTAKMVFDRAQKKASHLSFATVYNSLNYLVNKGLIRLVNFGEDSARYDAMMDRHDHLICKKCNKVEDFFKIESFEVGTHFPKPRGFKVEEVSIQFFGLCKECQKQ
ncbi:MAG: transcriptional repressor [Deltaproteobacteria bacterium]|nr:transcriptional repressor [Deltaproteobacteria bacterium]